MFKKKSIFEFRIESISFQNFPSYAYVRIFLFSLASILFTNFLRAQTNVSGTISQDTEWAIVGSPYTLIGVFGVAGASGNTLSFTNPGIYKVQVTEDDCASEFSAPLTITGDLQQTAKRVTIYPNPAETYLEVSGLKFDAQRAQLISVTGGENSILLENGEQAYRANIQHLSSGLYILRIAEGQVIHQLKFVKK